MSTLKACCQKESTKNLRKHSAVAICDGCKQLLLAYGNAEDFRKTRLDLDETGQSYQEGRQGKLWIISKARQR